MPSIGHLLLAEIHEGTLQPYIEQRRQAGIKSGTIARELTVVRRILTWPHGGGVTPTISPICPVPPLLALPDWEEDEAVPYPLSREEQSALCALLPRYLARMALFAVNTGLPEQGVCWLRWGREVALPELDTAVFVIPGRPMSYPDGQWPGEKNKEDQPVVLNRVARPVIAECRGNAPEYVFDYQGRRIHRMYNTAWKTAWRKAGLGLPADAKVCRGPHKT